MDAYFRNEHNPRHLPGPIIFRCGQTEQLLGLFDQEPHGCYRRTTHIKILELGPSILRSGIRPVDCPQFSFVKMQTHLSAPISPASVPV